MWDTLLPAVLRMSLTASTAILAVLLARILLHRAPRIFSYLLWSVVLLRLLCPISFSTHLSIMQFASVPTMEGEQTGYRLPGFSSHKSYDTQVSDTKTEKQAQKPATAQQHNSQKISRKLILWGTAVWLAGIAAILIHSIISLFMLRKQLTGALHLKDNIYLTDYVSSAFVFGILRPQIYLPSVLSCREQEYIILHEQVHVQRKDYLIKILAFTALAIHWFNPLVWLAFRLSDKDMEMSCDEAVMKKMDRDIRTEYSASLLKLATGKRFLSGTFPAFGEGGTRSRIKHILHYKKPTIAVILAAAVIMATTVIAAGGDPKKQNIEYKNTDSTAGATSTPADISSDENTSDGNTGSLQRVPAVGSQPGKTWTQCIGVNEDFTYTMECAFLRNMSGNTLEVDPVEYIGKETDPKRMEELGITMEYLNDMDGYELNNPDTSTQIWEIDENTEFIFVDWGLDFIELKEHYNGTADVMVRTKDSELFQRYLKTYTDSKPGMPFFFDVENGLVKRIVEQPFA